MNQLAGQGDSTTTGGSIVGASSTLFENSKRMALSGDLASCGKCKGGPFPILGTAGGWIEKGNAMVKDRDIVLCPCGQNHVIADSTIYFGSGKSATASASVTAVVVDSKVQFDQQFTLLDSVTRKPLGGSCMSSLDHPVRPLRATPMKMVKRSA
jgi:uncharacterized Zn-binding protein involved in type VI secretion